MPKPLIVDTAAIVKALSKIVTTEFTALLGRLEVSTSPAELEKEVARLALGWGREALSTAWSVQCHKATVADIEERGLDLNKITLRSEQDYTWTVASTLGPVQVASFAYRDRSVPFGSVTRVPAREVVMPLHRHCRSSELCLQWECWLGSRQAFRDAQASLSFFTHNATSLEDTTIARHMITVGGMVDTRWLYQRPEQIQEILRDRATRDRSTGRPLLYISSDAHLLRRYVDETWQAAWKNVNGIRLWCIDKVTGGIIHLGGEYTFGDCQVVQEAFEQLGALGVLPANGDFGDEVLAQYVVVTDGAAWLIDRVFGQFPGAVAVLDAWHAMEYLADHAAVLYIKGTAAAKGLYKRMIKALFGRSPSRPRRSPVRKGHKKRKRARRQRRPWPEAGIPSGIDVLLDLLRNHEPPSEHASVHRDFISKLERNASRMDYPALRQRGLQIGSGAMESLHRNASQQRLKAPGAKWCAETAQAVLNLRMLSLARRWEEFWSRPEHADCLVAAFAEGTAAVLRSAA